MSEDTTHMPRQVSYPAYMLVVYNRIFHRRSVHNFQNFPDAYYAGTAAVDSCSSSSSSEFVCTTMACLVDSRLLPIKVGSSSGRSGKTFCTFFARYCAQRYSQSGASGSAANVLFFCHLCSASIPSVAFFTFLAFLVFYEMTTESFDRQHAMYIPRRGRGQG